MQVQPLSDLENPPPSYTSATGQGEDDSSSLNPPPPPSSSPPAEIQTLPTAVLPPDTSAALTLPSVEQPPPNEGDELPPYYRGRPSQPTFDFVQESIAPPPPTRSGSTLPTVKRSPRRTLGIRLIFLALIVVPVVFVIWHLTNP